MGMGVSIVVNRRVLSVSTCYSVAFPGVLAVYIRVIHYECMSWHFICDSQWQGSLLKLWVGIAY